MFLDVLIDFILCMFTTMTICYFAEVKPNFKVIIPICIIIPLIADIFNFNL